MVGVADASSADAAKAPADSKFRSPHAPCIAAQVTGPSYAKADHVFPLRVQFQSRFLSGRRRGIAFVDFADEPALEKGVRRTTLARPAT
jgi:hypothetical protein